MHVGRSSFCKTLISYLSINMSGPLPHSFKYTAKPSKTSESGRIWVDGRRSSDAVELFSGPLDIVFKYNVTFSIKYVRVCECACTC